ncbi:SigE family RNA polymerase sigma factor [Nocardioides sp. cx-173]|uniref:SigE family RNA polymerase sigma factor n=1 Tax=Nocardioides sp. cx-173 TaxID=2898796 RepID=UPI001E2B6000|nr:SigE family RNA polymerase sigma factor [Nocardioides sp. cx-173]MCD4524479.1 SigE family RNA polymerase sigma factor [Nocardioides sp. cx-173]UGB43035.1 SigE family RNA polymerase sigma factor [Nocardioides sp. cx-173]
MPPPEDISFEEFVTARRAALLRTAYLLTGHPDDAEDLLQVSLAKAYPHWRRLSDRPEPYVRRIMARESVDRWRARRWRETLTALPVEPATSDESDAHDRRLELARALQALSPRQRAVVVLRYFDDLTERETARLLGISVGTVKSHAREALARLRHALTLEEEPVRDG